MSRYPCTCTHSRNVHRDGRGRCQAAGCSCLFAPPRQRVLSEPRGRGRATVDGSGLLVAYEPPTQPTAAQRMLREAETKKLERRLWRSLELAGLPLPDELEYLWALPERRFRADGFYRCRDGSHAGWLIEVDGGIWMKSGGGHSHPMHLEAQHERDNLASLLGFRCLRFTSKMVDDKGEAGAVAVIRRALQPAERLL